jgi:hypothetical protein
MSLGPMLLRLLIRGGRIATGPLLAFLNINDWLLHGQVIGV